MTPEELREICRLTAELTRMAQSERKNLLVDAFAVDLFKSLIDAYLDGGGVTMGEIEPVDLGEPGAMGELRPGNL